MNVSELFRLTDWVTQEIEQKQVISRYQSLASLIQTNVNPTPNQPAQPFENQKQELIQVLSSITTESLTKDQLEFLDKLGIIKYIQDAGIQMVEDILYKNVIDVSTSWQKLNEIIQQLTEGVSKSNQIKAALTNYVPDDVYELNGEVLMRVSFTGNAAMENIKDFKDWGNIWYDIGRGIAMAHNASPEDIKIVGAAKGSIIIELAVVASIAATASGIILSALKVAEKVLDIRKKAEEIKALKLKNEKLALELEEEANNEKKEGIQKITEDISISLNIKRGGEGDKVKALEVAIKNLVNFIERGGIVDFVIPEDSDTENQSSDSAELRIAFQEIRRIEKKLELLEYKRSSQIE